MELIFDREYVRPPELSLVLLDWDCRESYHFLDYLTQQNVPRDRYEVIWVEFYQKRSTELKARIKKAKSESRPSPIDRYIILDYPKRICYHKHLMYNVAIALARGEFVCNLDSDAMARPTLIESMLACFTRDPNMVLHLDELRSAERRFYPFNHPTVEEVEGSATYNGAGGSGKPAGLLDQKDPLHSRNYGSCMAARRSDMIAIGGADMHTDYLGYICGPYDMTFRLLNAGLKLAWHPTEWLYHTWHPGEAGDNNYCGPHDGRNMARAAIETRCNGRILPLVEHPTMARLRRGWDLASPKELLNHFAESTLAERWDFAALKIIEKTYMHYGGSAIRLMEKA